MEGENDPELCTRVNELHSNSSLPIYCVPMGKLQTFLTLKFLFRKMGIITNCISTSC